MGEFIRILNISKTVTVSLQLLQTISILIQNLRREHAICKLVVEERTKICSSLVFLVDSNTVGRFYDIPCEFFADYMFSNEHVNYLITYSFDFRNEELLSYYISFLRFVFFSFSSPYHYR